MISTQRYYGRMHLELCRISELENKGYRRLKTSEGKKNASQIHGNTNPICYIVIMRDIVSEDEACGPVLHPSVLIIVHHLLPTHFLLLDSHALKATPVSFSLYCYVSTVVYIRKQVKQFVIQYQSFTS